MKTMAANDGSGLGAVGAAVADLVDEMGQLGVEEIILRHRGAGVIGVSIRYNLHPACGACEAEAGDEPKAPEPSTAEAAGVPAGKDDRPLCTCGYCTYCQRRGALESSLNFDQPLTVGIAAGGLVPRSGLMAAAGAVH